MLIRTSLIVLPPTSVGGLSVGTTNEQGGAGHGGLLSRPITAWFNSMSMWLSPFALIRSMPA